MIGAVLEFLAGVFVGVLTDVVGVCVLRVVTLGRWPRGTEPSEFTRGERVVAACAGLAVSVPLVFVVISLLG